MTVSYTADVNNNNIFGCFTKILIKWRGSVYKLIYKELIAYIILYFIVNIFYRSLLVPYSQCEEEPQCVGWIYYRDLFEKSCSYFKLNLNSIPIIFVMAFYVNIIMTRWWHQYILLPWPDTFAIMTTALVRVDGRDDERGRMIRRSLVRYVNLSYCIAMRTVSFRLKKRFPTLEHLVHSGLMERGELAMFRDLDHKVVANKWFLPLVWAADIVSRCIEEGRLHAATASSLMEEVGRIRTDLTTILSYDWISVPLVYTQVTDTDITIKQ